MRDYTSLIPRVHICNWQEPNPSALIFVGFPYTESSAYWPAARVHADQSNVERGGRVLSDTAKARIYASGRRASQINLVNNQTINMWRNVGQLTTPSSQFLYLYLEGPVPSKEKSARSTCEISARILFRHRNGTFKAGTRRRQSYPQGVWERAPDKETSETFYRSQTNVTKTRAPERIDTAALRWCTVTLH